jgi:hypothetical protein
MDAPRERSLDQILDRGIAALGGERKEGKTGFKWFQSAVKDATVDSSKSKKVAAAITELNGLDQKTLKRGGANFSLRQKITTFLTAIENDAKSSKQLKAQFSPLSAGGEPQDTVYSQLKILCSTNLDSGVASKLASFSRIDEVAVAPKEPTTATPPSGSSPVEEEQEGPAPEVVKGGSAADMARATYPHDERARIAAEAAKTQSGN